MSRAGGRGQGEEEQKESDGGSKKVRALVKLLTGETSKGEKKSKKKRGRKRKRVGHGGGDSPSSSDSDGSRRSSPDWEESESSSTELLAPLQKRSSKKPGAVLKMLVHHAKRPIICGRDREGPTGDRWDQDLHIFQPACPALPQPGEQGYEGDEPRSRLPRRAKVGSAGETWAQFVLEVQGAPTSLLLEAKRHGRLVQKSQGKKPWRPKGEGDPWRSSGKGGDGSYRKAPLSLLIDSRVYNRL